MSKPTGKTYRITTVHDFLKVPKSRRAACLAEFPSYLECAELAKRILKGTDSTVKDGDFVWTDDGEPGVRDVVFKFPDGEEVSFRESRRPAEGREG